MATAAANLGGVQSDSENMLLIFLGLSIVNDQGELYELSNEKLGHFGLGTWKEAILRTDSKIRQLLNLTLHSMIWACQAEQAKKTLMWARSNTLILHMSDDWI